MLLSARRQWRARPKNDRRGSNLLLHLQQKVAAWLNGSDALFLDGAQLLRLERLAPLRQQLIKRLKQSGYQKASLHGPGSGGRAEEGFQHCGESAELMLSRAGRPVKLRGDDLPGSRFDRKVEISNNTFQSQERRAQSVTMFQHPAARLPGKLRNQAQADQILCAPVCDRIALRSVGAREGPGQKRPWPQALCSGLPDVRTLPEANSSDAGFASVPSLNDRQQTLQRFKLRHRINSLHHDQRFRQPCSLWQVNIRPPMCDRSGRSCSE